MSDDEELEKWEERSTDYLQGARDCADYVIDQLCGEVPQESRVWEILGRLQEGAELRVKIRFERDLGVRHLPYERKTGNVATAKAVPEEA
jgi:hypothetical protein